MSDISNLEAIIERKNQEILLLRAQLASADAQVQQMTRTTLTSKTLGKRSLSTACSEPVKEARVESRALRTSVPLSTEDYERRKKNTKRFVRYQIACNKARGIACDACTENADLACTRCYTEHNRKHMAKYNGCILCIPCLEKQTGLADKARPIVDHEYFEKNYETTNNNDVEVCCFACGNDQHVETATCVLCSEAFCGTHINQICGLDDSQLVCRNCIDTAMSCVECNNMLVRWVDSARCYDCQEKQKTECESCDQVISLKDTHFSFLKGKHVCGKCLPPEVE